MLRTLLKSKIHRATITGSDLHYVGSITLDPDLLGAAGLLPNEMVAVLDVENGARFETYVIPGDRGAREVKINGAAARLVHTGDKVIIIAYGAYSEVELVSYRPSVVHVDDRNQIVAVDHAVATLAAEPVDRSIDSTTVTAAAIHVR